MARKFQKNLIALIRGVARILTGAIFVPLPSGEHNARV